LLKENLDLGIAYASSPLLEGIDSISHGFLTRLGGVSPAPFASLNFDTRDGDSHTNTEQNRALVAKLLGFDTNRLLTMNQVHGSNVLTIDKPVNDISFTGLSKISADAIITNQCGIAIGVLTADCVPILLLDPVKKVIGIVHAGWRGTVKGVVQKAIDAMVKQFDTDKQTILAAIGPSIGPCCYKVDEVVIKELGVLAPDKGIRGQGSGFGVAEFIKKQDNTWKLDLKKANFVQMLDIGLLEKNIAVEDFCTSCRNDIFFSYRKDGKVTGRQLNFVMMKGI